jgi:hypothetical protein
MVLFLLLASEAGVSALKSNVQRNRRIANLGVLAHSPDISVFN